MLEIMRGPHWGLWRTSMPATRCWRSCWPAACMPCAGDAYRPIRPDLASDFLITMLMRQQRLRTVLEPDAKCVEGDLSDCVLPGTTRWPLAGMALPQPFS